MGVPIYGICLPIPWVGIIHESHSTYTRRLDNRNKKISRTFLDSVDGEIRVKKKASVISEEGGFFFWFDGIVVARLRRKAIKSEDDD